jgi:hypothetical protein
VSGYYERNLLYRGGNAKMQRITHAIVWVILITGLIYFIIPFVICAVPGWKTIGELNAKHTMAEVEGIIIPEGAVLLKLEPIDLGMKKMIYKFVLLFFHRDNHIIYQHCFSMF